jgi:hypothetical protein
LREFRVGRDEVDARHRAIRAHRLQIDLRHALQRVTKEVQPHRHTPAPGRKDIQDAPAERELTGLFDRFDARVARARQPLQQPSQVVLLAHAKRPHQALQALGRRHQLHQRLDRTDDDPGLRPCRDLANGGEPIGKLLEARVALAREHLQGRESDAPHAQRREFVAHFVGVVEVRHNHDDGARGRSAQRRRHERGCRSHRARRHHPTAGQHRLGELPERRTRQNRLEKIGRQVEPPRSVTPPAGRTARRQQGGLTANCIGSKHHARDYSTVTSGRSLSKVFGPMPLTLSRSSSRLNSPCAVR